MIPCGFAFLSEAWAKPRILHWVGHVTTTFSQVEALLRIAGVEELYPAFFREVRHVEVVADFEDLMGKSTLPVGTDRVPEVTTSFAVLLLRV